MFLADIEPYRTENDSKNRNQTIIQIYNFFSYLLFQPMFSNIFSSTFQAFLLIVAGLFTCQGAPQYQNSQNYGSERCNVTVFFYYPFYIQMILALFLTR